MKDFDAKQFLLEKGEQVGLGFAVTLMVLMLIFSLFMPSKGFFSGSPKTKADELKRRTEQLENALRTSQPTKKDLPEEREGKLIALNIQPSNPESYATENWFEPRMKEDTLRRPPKIYNVVEAVAQVAAVPIDTYLFRLNAKPPQVMVLEDKSRKALGSGAPGKTNPLIAPLLRSLSNGPASMMPSTPNPFFNRQRTLLEPSNLNPLRALQGAVESAEYEGAWIPLDSWDPEQQMTAHQLRPLRMAIIAGSFPYKQQLEEHMHKLRLKSIDDVLSETIGKGEDQSAAFDFVSVEVQRKEVDANGKDLSDWYDPQLKESYQLWLQYTYLPFQPENPKYEFVMPNGGKGLVMPLLREFRPSKTGAGKLPFPGMMFPGMMRPGMTPPGVSAPPAEAPPEEGKTKYPDVVADLPKIKETLDKIREAQPKQIAQAKFHKVELLNPFDRNVAPAGDNSQTLSSRTSQEGTNTEQSYIPDYVLVRVVDVHIEPGKHYRYRLKIRMANPNYQRSDVASPEYKERKFLESNDWYELPQIVNVPPEMFYYVVDEAQGMSQRDINALPHESAQYRLLRARAPSPTSEQVVFQFHRWVESTQLSSKDTEPIFVGEWAVADRVFVARGEYIGRKVNVDVPIWKFTQNKFILPVVENQRNSRRFGRQPDTGIDIDFGQDPPENNLILVDFEGGRGLSIPSPFAANKSITEDSAVEVLMLSPDGKLLARNSAKDTNDEERKKRREEVFKRIQEVREGKGND